MSNDKQNKEELNLLVKPIANRFGFISGFIAVLSSLILFFTNLEFDTLFSALPFVLFIITLIVSQHQIVKANNNLNFDYNSLFKIGFRITIITALFILIYTFIYCNILEPDFVNKMSEITRDKLIEQKLTEEQIEKAVKISNKFSTPISVPFIKFVLFTILGLVCSAIGAAIFKNEK